LELRQSPAALNAGAQTNARIAAAFNNELKAAFGCSARILETSAHAGGLPEGCCYVVLALASDGRRALVELETGLAAAMIDRLSGGKGGSFCPQEPSASETAALSYLALHAVRAARSVDGLESALSPRFLMLARDANEVGAILAGERDWVAVELELAIGEVKGGGRLLLPAATARRMARTMGAPARGPLAPEVACAELTATLLAGSAGLLEDQLDQLGEGDAVVLGGLARSPKGLCGDACLVFPDFHLLGRLDGQGFTLASVSDALSPEALMHDSPTQVSSLPIEVQVELKRLKIPLAKLDQIKPGTVLELGTALCDPVILRVGDRAVARAELVDIEGELGARILALLP
jgi:type III secretion protein Q